MAINYLKFVVKFWLEGVWWACKTMLDSCWEGKREQCIPPSARLTNDTGLKVLVCKMNFTSLSRKSARICKIFCVVLSTLFSSPMPPVSPSPSSSPDSLAPGRRIEREKGNIFCKLQLRMTDTCIYLNTQSKQRSVTCNKKTIHNIHPLQFTFQLCCHSYIINFLRHQTSIYPTNDTAAILHAQYVQNIL